jgi:hypothetical protein
MPVVKRAVTLSFGRRGRQQSNFSPGWHFDEPHLILPGRRLLVVASARAASQAQEATPQPSVSPLRFMDQLQASVETNQTLSAPVVRHSFM